MKRIRRSSGLVAALAVAALVLGACSSDNDGGGASGPKLDDKALDSVVNPSDAKGGTLKFGLSGEWGDTVDPGETYYGYSWNMLRNYARTLVMFKPAPGKEGLEIVPDMATGLGEVSDGGKTWTYKIQPNLKYEDGSPITTADIKYAALRSTDKKTFPNGPGYFESLLDINFCNADEGVTTNCYDGPYRTPDFNTDSGIETPDDTTIVFHLKEPFAGFDYIAQLPQTAPVPEAKDTGSKYREHVISSGPYMFKGKYNPTTGFTLIRNPNWDAATDPNRKALPDEMTVKLNMQAEDVDNQIIAGTLDVDVAGSGVQLAALPKVLQDKALQERADNPTTARTWYTSIAPTVAPFDNIECRKAVLYGMSPVSYQSAFGGVFAGGEIAGSLLPPLIPGHEGIDPYGLKDNPQGQEDKAKEALTACGQPNGFETTMGYRDDRPKEKAEAEAFQNSLGKIGITVNLKALPSGTYFSDTCGNPKYVVNNKLGLCANGWQADWNDGYGFLSNITDSRLIRPDGGSSNISVRVPEINTLIDQGSVELDETKRNGIWAQIDKLVMDNALVYPGIYAKAVLVRSSNATNIFVNDAYSQYDYTAMGVK